jgi:glycerol-3-phosphate acyltransferase PlsX
MRIGLDIMGGDFAPQATVQGAILASKELADGAKIVLFGDEKVAREIIAAQNADPEAFEFVNTSQVIEMGDHPAKAFAQKTDSSLAVGFQMLSAGKIDGLASAGNTGAMLVGTMFTIKTMPGVIRPCIAAPIPNKSEIPTLLLDVGLNPDAKPEVLYQYAIFGSLYAQHVYGINTPKVALLNLGSERDKGNLVAKATYDLMENSQDFNFIGNVEGNDLFYSTKADVVVCDGFVGNVVLKAGEAFYKLTRKRGISDEHFEKFNFENVGGTPIMGVNSTVIIGHGISNEKAIKNMVLQTQRVIEAKLPEKFKEIIK